MNRSIFFTKKMFKHSKRCLNIRLMSKHHFLSKKPDIKKNNFVIKSVCVLGFSSSLLLNFKDTDIFDFFKKETNDIETNSNIKQLEERLIAAKEKTKEKEKEREKKKKIEEERKRKKEEKEKKKEEVKKKKEEKRKKREDEEKKKREEKRKKREEEEEEEEKLKKIKQDPSQIHNVGDLTDEFIKKCIKENIYVINHIDPQHLLKIDILKAIYDEFTLRSRSTNPYNYGSLFCKKRAEMFTSILKRVDLNKLPYECWEFLGERDIEIVITYYPKNKSLPESLYKRELQSAKTADNAPYREGYSEDFYCSLINNYHWFFERIPNPTYKMFMAYYNNKMSNSIGYSLSDMLESNKFKEFSENPSCEYKMFLKYLCDKGNSHIIKGNVPEKLWKSINKLYSQNSIQPQKLNPLLLISFFIFFII